MPYIPMLFFLHSLHSDRSMIYNLKPGTCSSLVPKGNADTIPAHIRTHPAHTLSPTITARTW